MLFIFVPVFLIVFVCSLIALEKSPLSEHKILLAFSVAMLSVFSLSTSPILVFEGNMLVPVVLTPYAAMTIAMLIVLILVFLIRFQEWTKGNGFSSLKNLYDNNNDSVERYKNDSRRPYSDEIPKRIREKPRVRERRKGAK